MRNVRDVTQPAAEPITLEEARLHLKLDAEGSPASHPDDALIETLITAARQHVERYTYLAVAERQVEARVTAFDDDGVDIPVSPVQSIVSVKYVDSSGVEQTVDPGDYELGGSLDGPVLLLKYGSSWPTDVYDRIDAVRITVEAGFTTGSPNDNPLPGPVRAAMLLVLTHLYENRAAVQSRQTFHVPLGVESLLWPYRVTLGLA